MRTVHKNWRLYKCWIRIFWLPKITYYTQHFDHLKIKIKHLNIFSHLTKFIRGINKYRRVSYYTCIMSNVTVIFNLTTTLGAHVSIFYICENWGSGDKWSKNHLTRKWKSQNLNPVLNDLRAFALFSVESSPVDLSCCFTWFSYVFITFLFGTWLFWQRKMLKIYIKSWLVVVLKGFWVTPFFWQSANG